MSRKLDVNLGAGQYATAPSLLPTLTRFASPGLLLFAAQQAESLSINRFAAVPAVGRATAAVIARRAEKMTSQSLYRAATSLPWIGGLTNLQPELVASPHLKAQIGVRIGDVGVVRQAISSAFGGEELVLTSAAGLPLVGTSSELLKITLDELPSLSIGSLHAVAAHLDPASNAQLLQSWVHSQRDPAVMVAGIVEIMPWLGEESREQAAHSALSYIKTGALQSTQPWMVSYLVRRLRETARGAKAPELQLLAASLPAPWREVVGRQGRLEHVDDETALRSSYPHEVSGPVLRTEADLAISRMVDVWGDVEKPEYRGFETQPEPLYLNAQVNELHGEVGIPRLDAFTRGRSYRVTVYLAIKDLSSGITADTPAPLDRSLPHELYISFFASWLKPSPPVPIQIREIGGSESTTASVEFVVPPNLATIALQVILLERIGKELTPIQSGVLSGDVVQPGGKGNGISLRIDPHPTRPPNPTTEGVTIMLGDDTLAVYGSPEVDGKFLEPGELKALRTQLGVDALTQWVAIEGVKDEKQLATSLVDLAARGRDVLEIFKKRLVANPETRRRLFDTDDTVRLWSRDLNTDLPVEFIYDGPIPDLKQPSLCAQFFDGLNDGACRKCENRGNAICAFDFWAFRRRIERRVADDLDAGSDKNIARPSAKALLSVSAPAAFGASVTVSADSRKAIIAALKEGGVGIECPAPNWDGWKKLLEDPPHRLLVLLSHTEQGTKLEIENDLIDRQWITNAYVNPHEEQPGPFVLLTGCETARPEYAFLSFVSKFLDQGAAVVVGTLALIREDASAAATLQVLRTLREVVSSETEVEHRTVGEIMRLTRCRLLANKDLTGLNLVAYGDADWEFAPRGVR